MVVSRDAGHLVETMLELVEAASTPTTSRRCARASRTGARCRGWATGSGRRSTSPAALRERARPESVLVTDEVREALGDDAGRLAFTEAGSSG